MSSNKKIDNENSIIEDSINRNIDNTNTEIITHNNGRGVIIDEWEKDLEISKENFLNWYEPLRRYVIANDLDIFNDK
ncbi:hypothetical protein H8356DRAFT_1346767 [Neocallimastix lanati (nom. inval.)]|nr:hypothetical protein H8356DRAFT_1346767 [Neocallimastix sp. JGI-2020a]